MKRNWTPSELESTWLLEPVELEWLGRKAEPTSLGFALSLQVLPAGGTIPGGAT